MKKFLLALLCIFAFFLRTYHVSTNPPALSWDEVAIGYNAYSILKTGRDEHGRFFPLDAFASYGDYKPPLAVYSAVPFVFLFGLTDLAIRLPAAVFGTLTVLLTYLLVLELFSYEFRVAGSRSQKDILNNSQLTNPRLIAFLTATLLAISPWHINISRGGFEANIALFFIVFGVWLVLSSRRSPKRYLYAFLPFVAAIYTFNSARYFSPFICLGLFIYTFSHMRKNWKYTVMGLIISLVFLIPIAPHLVSKEARLRFKEVNIFSESAVVVQSNERIRRENASWVSKIVNNRRVGYARSFLMHYVDHLEPEYLFVRGDGNPKFSIQDVGQLYIIESPFLIIGIFALCMSYPSVAVFLFYWLLTSVIPAAVARETPHALRTLNSLPTWYVFVAFGILTVYQYISVTGKSMSRIAYCLLLVVLYFFSFSYYLHTYFAHYPKEFSGEWQYGYKQALQFAEPIASSYTSIVVSEKIGRPYMYTLFYTQTSPDEYVAGKKSYFDSAGFYHVSGFGKYHFASTLEESLKPNTLYIWDSDLVPKGVNVLQTIRLLNGQAVLTIFDTGSVKI